MDPIFLAGLGFTALTAATLVALHAGKVVVPRVGEWEHPPTVFVLRDGVWDLADVAEAMKNLTQVGHSFGPLLTGDVPPAGAIVLGLFNEAQREANRIASTRWEEQFDLGEISEAALEPVPLESDPRDVLGPIDELGRITSAYIGGDRLTLENRDVVRILMHELCHALGYLHVETAVFGLKREKLSREEKLARKAAGEKHPKGEKTDEARLGLIGRKTGHLMNPIYEKGGYDTRGLEPGALDEAREVVKKHRRAT